MAKDTMEKRKELSPSLLIFGGTTEGRLAISVCEEAGNAFFYSTKGEDQNVKMHNGIRLCGAMTSEDIISFADEHNVKCIIDAAHPFAENLHKSLEQTALPVIRLQRLFSAHRSDIVYCRDYEDVLEKLQQAGIKHLLALSGANTISRLKPYWREHTTTFRVLDRGESREIARRNGLPSQNLVYYKHQPSKEEEMELMKAVGCDAIITKESGETGGFDEKVEAALELGLRVFVLEHPQLPLHWTYVTGKHTLRRAIEHIVPDFFPLKTGLTTGTCATGATMAALLSLLYDEQPEEVSFSLPDGEILTIPVTIEKRGVASVIKDFSDDPDVTRGCRITSTVRPGTEGIRFLQGKGVGTVTLPGLGIPVGGPAINVTPRRMMEKVIKTVTNQPVDITISVENGEEIARKTFNPKVGVINGISIIGTSGIVSPLSNEAFIESIGRELEVAKAIGCKAIGIASGKKGETYLKNEYPGLRVIHYGNFVGETLKKVKALGFEKVVVGIMIGKAVKLAEGNLDTHSHKVVMNKEFLKSIADVNAHAIDSVSMARELWDVMPQSFFDRVKDLCYKHCRSVYADGDLEIKLIRDK